MHINDAPVQVGDLKEVNVIVDQGTIDALSILIHWLEGYTSAKGGTIPGHFQLIMHYRQLSEAIRRIKQKP